MMMKAGIYPGISHPDYREIDAVSNTYLGKLKHCPANARVPDTDSPEKILGRAFHTYILEHESFAREYVVAPSTNRRKKNGRAEWAEFAIENIGKTILPEEDMTLIQEMYIAVHKHPTAMELLNQGEREQTIIWQDEETGLWCKCRPDQMPLFAGTLADLKSTADASEQGFRRQVLAHGYYRQDAMYREGIACVTGKIFDAFAFIAVEKKKPFRVAVYTLDLDFQQLGYDEFHQLLRLEKQCRETGVWHNFNNDGVVELYYKYK